jgi:nucleoside-diphosphate kinase
MAQEKTFLIVKPEGVEQGHVGAIIARFEKQGFRVVALKLEQLSKELAKQQYKEHREKAFFDELISYISSGPTVAMVIEGENAITAARNLVGEKDPKEAKPGTIRGDYGLDVMRNAIHASDSKASAKREVAIHFGKNLTVN